MGRKFTLLAILLWTLACFPRDKAEEWIEVRSPHFSVVTNSNEKQARHVADQFERMRSVFHTLFPQIQIDSGVPMIVLAIKDEKDFRALEPPDYLAKGQLKLAGLFLSGADKNYVLLRLDAQGEHPYATVYHEYTHLLLSKADWMPLWLNEGLAEYYQNTDIREKEVALGEPSPENLELLRENRLLPLSTLFAVDHTSPYYHEENKGSIFYAESWALTHYLELKDLRDHAHHITDYAQLLSQKMDAVAAAAQAFGDLKQLQAALDEYVHQSSYQYLRMPGATDVNDDAFQVAPITAPQADAVRADFLAYNSRPEDARALLKQTLQEDPNNVLAHETMGFLEFREGHLEQARKWYAEAVQLDSQSYLACYYFAAISMNNHMEAAEETQVENSLRNSIKLNPKFAPSYDRLAVLLATRHRNLDEAHMMALNAVSLEPENLGYRINTASVLLQMGRGNDAVTVIRNAMHLAKTPEQTAMATSFLRSAENYAQMQEKSRAFHEQITTEETTVVSPGVEADAATDSAPPDQAPAGGPHHFATGVMKNVRCSAPAIDLNLISGGKALALHANNYFKVQYSTLNVTLKGDLNPCADLEGRPAKIEYAESSKGFVAVAIEIHK